MSSPPGDGKNSNRRFLIGLIAVGSLTLLCGVAAGLIAFWGGPALSPPIAAYQERLSCLFTAGAGVIFGLLGGRFTGSG